MSSYKMLEKENEGVDKEIYAQVQGYDWMNAGVLLYDMVTIANKTT